MNNPIFVIGGGNSLRGFNFTKLIDKTTIVSNKAIFVVPNANVFITTDYTFITWMKNHNVYNLWKRQPAKKIFVANCIAPFIQFIDGKITDTRYNLVYNLEDFNQTIICKSAKNVGFDFAHFNSGYNSGFSAMQYAIIRKFKKIYLLGMDMCSNTETHFHGGYGKSREKFNQNLKNYFPHFANILQQLKKERSDIKIISCSKNSRLNQFIEYKDIEEVLK